MLLFMIFRFFKRNYTYCNLYIKNVTSQLFQNILTQIYTVDLLHKSTVSTT